MTHPLRSFLYVPGYDEHRIAKAYRTKADCIVLDLEDAVPASRRSEARSVVAGLLDTTLKPTHVRLSAAWEEDLEALDGAGPLAVRLAKCDSPDAVRAVSQALDERGMQAFIYAVIESALGVERMVEIASADRRVAGLILGEADLRADLRVTDDEGLNYARLRAVSASRAVGLPGPIQSVFTDVHDADGLLRTTVWGRSVGFSGRSAIHPSQIEFIHQAYTPSDVEVARAQEVVDMFEAAVEVGSATALTFDGRFVDPATVASARWTLQNSRKR